MTSGKYLSAAIIFLTAVAFAPRSTTRIWLIGDSTISIKEIKAYPETGWGMPFANFWDSNVVVENRAKNGRSTRSFMAEGLWQPVVSALAPGDHVLIQFGHNDEVKEKVERYTSPEDFENNLLRFVTETRKARAVPVLITPVSRRRFDSAGTALQTHTVYSNIVRKLAAAEHVALIDLDEKSRSLFQKMGRDNSKLLFNHLAPGEHPNYPAGKVDDTHFNELGARLMAQIVLADLREVCPELVEHIVVPAAKKN